MGNFKQMVAMEWDPPSAGPRRMLRQELLSKATSMRGGVVFMDGAVRSWTAWDLFAWLDEYVVSPGWMRMPRTLREPGVPPVVLNPHTGIAPGFEVLTLVARARVGEALLGYLSSTPDERFLHAAIHGRRVRRSMVGGRPAWVPSPRETDFLSDVVLSLFAADLLRDANQYRSNMCICPRCHRVSFTSGGQGFGLRCTRCNGDASMKVA